MNLPSFWNRRELIKQFNFKSWNLIYFFYSSSGFFFNWFTNISIKTLKNWQDMKKIIHLKTRLFLTCFLGVTAVGWNGGCGIVSILLSLGSGMSSKISSGSDLSSTGLVLMSLWSSLNSLSEFKSISSAIERLLDLSSTGDKSIDLSSSNDISALASTLIW